MDRELIQSLAKDFESYAIEIDGVECWFARDLQTPLGYDKWENFYNVIQKAKIACENTGNIIDDHFLDVRKMVDIGSQATREIDDIILTRYACYLKTLIERGIKPENLPPEEDIKKLERRLTSENKKSLEQVKKLKRPRKKS